MADSKEMDNVDERSKLNADNDTAKIKFQQGGGSNGEAKIEMPEGTIGYQCGLTKEELMKYANDPFWVFLRRVLLILFWLLWIAMLVGAVAIIVVTPKCAAPKQPDWYESSVVYQLRADEFADGDGDQKSDLRGIVNKLPYLEEISVSAIVVDGLFNPDNQRIIVPEIGSFDDFKTIAEKQKVLVKIPCAKLGNLATSESVQSDFLITLKFWLEKGAAGFVFDELELIEKSALPKLTEQWHDLVRNFSTEDFPRVSILSSYSPDTDSVLETREDEELCLQKNSSTVMVLDYQLTRLNKGFSSQDFVSALEKHTTARNKTACSRRSNLVLSNGDVQPLISRFDAHERDRLVMFSLLADATPFMYFGEEYGKQDRDMPSKLTRSHTNTAQPMDWNSVEDLKKSNENSHFRVFTETSKLRLTENSIRMGSSVLKTLADDKVVAMSRLKTGNPGFVVVTNFDTAAQKINLTDLSSHIPDTGEVDIVSTGSQMSKKTKINFADFEIAAKDTVVIQFAPKT